MHFTVDCTSLKTEQPEKNVPFFPQLFFPHVPKSFSCSCFQSSFCKFFSNLWWTLKQFFMPSNVAFNCPGGIPIIADGSYFNVRWYNNRSRWQDIQELVVVQSTPFILNKNEPETSRDWSLGAFHIFKCLIQMLVCVDKNISFFKKIKSYS